MHCSFFLTFVVLFLSKPGVVMKFHRFIALAALSCLGAVALANTTVMPQPSAQKSAAADTQKVFAPAEAKAPQLASGTVDKMHDAGKTPQAVTLHDHAKKVWFTAGTDFKLSDGANSLQNAAVQSPDAKKPNLFNGMYILNSAVAKIRQSPQGNTLAATVLDVSEMVGTAGKVKYGPGVQTGNKLGGSFTSDGTYVVRATPQSGTLFALSGAAKVTGAA